MRIVRASAARAAAVRPAQRSATRNIAPLYTRTEEKSASAGTSVAFRTSKRIGKLPLWLGFGYTPQLHTLQRHGRGAAAVRALASRGTKNNIQVKGGEF